MQYFQKQEAGIKAIHKNTARETRPAQMLLKFFKPL